MEWIKYIIESPWYIFLFGGGGVLVIVLTIISIIKKKKNSSNDNNDFNANIENKANININIEVERPDIVENANMGEIKYNLQVDKSNTSVKVSYENYSFQSDDFYVHFLTAVEEKKRKRDKINYE